MRLSRTDLVPVLAIIAGGAVGVATSASLLWSSAEQAPVAVPAVAPSVTAGRLLSRVVVRPEQGEGTEVSQRNILHIIVQPSGIVDVKRGENPQIQQVRPQEIEGLWRQAVTANPDLIAAVKSHPETPYRYMVDVLDALHSTNAGRISLRVLEN